MKTLSVTRLNTFLSKRKINFGENEISIYNFDSLLKVLHYQMQVLYFSMRFSYIIVAFIAVSFLHLGAFAVILPIAPFIFMI